MNPSQPYSSSDSRARSHLVDHETAPRSTVSWGAIFAGTTAALALQVLFMMLGAGLGFAIYSPATSDNPVASLSIGALIIQSICAITSLWLGGWVAGRFSPVCVRATGWLHGFSVWCAATVGGVMLVALGAGWMMGDLSKLAGGGLSAVGEPVAAVAGGSVDLAANAVEQSSETIKSYVEEALSNRSEDGIASEEIRAKREVGLAVGRLFNPFQDGNNAANREAAVTALVDHTGMSQAEANRTITEWTSTYEEMQADLDEMMDAAAEKAREAAQVAADALATFSLWAFVGFLFGALAATWGGYLGAICATKCEESTDVAKYDGDSSGPQARRGVPVSGS